ncbi:MAG: hypothetical protein LBF05_03350 [Tannerella sp.]|jgi:hypothetical protein|nr:hypothetical protein [Tannerella sp.]
MSDSKLESKIREYAEEIFGKDVELPSGHRERFEQRLKELHTGCEAGNRQEAGSTEQRSGKVISFKKWIYRTRHNFVKRSGRIRSQDNIARSIIASVAVAVVIAGFVFLLNPSAGSSQPNQELANVRNYYNMQLEEQLDATRQLIRQVDGAYREILLANIEQIKNEPLPDVQITDDEYIVLIADVYTGKIEVLQNLQNIIRENI